MHDFLTGLSEIRKGGSYYRFVRMIDALANRNLKILVYSISPAPLTKENVHWRCLSMISKLPFRNIMFLLAFPFLALHYIFKNTTGKIIVFGPIYASLLLPLRLCKRCRIYCMVRGMLSREYGYQGRVRVLRYLVSLFEKVGLHVSHRIIVVSRTLGEKILEGTHIREDKIRHLPNEIPYLYKETIDNLYGRRIWEEKVPKGSLRIFAGGIITPRKNFEMVFNALGSLKIPFHFCLAGKPVTPSDDAYFRVLQRLISHLELEEKVSWLGWLPRERLLGVLATSHLLVGASHHEGMSNILLEAWPSTSPAWRKTRRNPSN